MTLGSRFGFGGSAAARSEIDLSDLSAWTITDTPGIDFPRQAPCPHLAPPISAVLLLPPESLRSSALKLTQDSVLTASFAPALPQISADGMTIQIDFVEKKGGRVTLFHRHFRGPSRRWCEVRLDLGDMAGCHGHVEVRAGAGPLDQPAGDWLALAGLTVVADGRTAPPLSMLDPAARENRLLVTDYPYVPKVRDLSRARGFRRKIAERIEAGREQYAALLDKFLAHRNAFEAISLHADEDDPSSPYWLNCWLPAFDAMALYVLMAERKPKLYLEVGSGNSTRFVRRAIRDLGLDTRIVSIDPNPRAEVDAICDEVVRVPLEEVDDALFGRVRAGDVVFIDNSHRSFQNSDVTVFFTEILPGLPRGCIYGIHDIFLPYDYGEEIPVPAHFGATAAAADLRARRDAFVRLFYNEQYLLACYLAGGADGDRVLLPVAYAAGQSDLFERLNPLWASERLRGIEPWGGAFWMEKA